MDAICKDPYPTEMPTSAYWTGVVDSGGFKESASGQYLSWQIDHWELKPAVDNYERCSPNGGLMTFSPIPPDGSLHIRSFLYLRNLPNL